MAWVSHGVEDMNIFGPSLNLQTRQTPKAIDDAKARCALARWSWNTVTNPHQNHRRANVTRCQQEQGYISTTDGHCGLRDDVTDDGDP